jgi:UrcA family protein
MNTLTRNTFKALIAAAALGSVLATGARAGEVPEVRVRYGDLNLHTAAGTTILRRRIAAAAVRVCGDADELDLSRRVRVDACRTRATADALAAVRNAGIELASSK